MGARPILVKTAIEHIRPFTCHRCGEVIGVYEPLVIVKGVYARATSRAAEPDLNARAEDYYHRACYSESNSTSSIAG